MLLINNNGNEDDDGLWRSVALARLVLRWEAEENRNPSPFPLLESFLLRSRALINNHSMVLSILKYRTSPLMRRIIK